MSFWTFMLVLIVLAILGINPASEEEGIHKEHGHLTLADLLAEIRADEAAGKREHAHFYGKDSPNNSEGGITKTPAAEKTKDKEIER
jgi:hypothetical protein